MNATGDSDENPEFLASGVPGLPLSAPVAATMLPRRGLNVQLREPDDAPLPHPGVAYPPVAQPEVAHPPVAPAPVANRHVLHSPVPAQLAAQAPVTPQPIAHAAAAPPPGRHDFSPDPAALNNPPAGRGLSDDPPDDPTRVILREHLDALRVRAANASSWLETSVHYARLINRDGIVPVTARFSRDDIEFLGRAREEVLGFAELGLRLLELHAPLDAGGISTDPTSPILRCRSCMWRWPCPTFRMLTDAMSHLPHADSPPAR